MMARTASGAQAARGTITLWGMDCASKAVTCATAAATVCRPQIASTPWPCRVTRCQSQRAGYSWIGVWKSEDMSNASWTLVREARDDTWPDCVYFRVHVVYNRRTKRYVLWVNLNRGPADYAVGTSLTPEGPFTWERNVFVGQRSAGDFDILVDDDDAAYIIYTDTSAGHVMRIERLTDDYLASAAGPPPPSPPPPLPPGFTLVGNGACRDDRGKEPDFETNEPARKVGGSEAQCAAACIGAAGCAAFAFCASNDECLGACHLYMASAAPTLNSSWSWDDRGGGVLPVSTVTTETWWRCLARSHAKLTIASPIASPTASPIASPTASPTVSPTPNARSQGHTDGRQGSRQVGSASYITGGSRHTGDSRLVEVEADAAHASAAHVGPSNVSSGIFGNTFVEAPALFKRREACGTRTHPRHRMCGVRVSGGRSRAAANASHSVPEGRALFFERFRPQPPHSDPNRRKPQPRAPFAERDPIPSAAGGVYYALFDNCCCFCGHGSGVGVYTAVHPLGPYTYHDNVGCDPSVSLTPGCGCGMTHKIPGGQCDFYGESLTRAQQNFVIQSAQPDGSMLHVWTGDRWQSAADGIKAHDLQYWAVLDFVAVPCSQERASAACVNGTIDLPRHFVWQDEIKVDVMVAPPMVAY